MTLAISFGETIVSPYSTLAEALLAGCARAQSGYFLSIKPDGRHVRLPWGQSLERATAMVGALQRQGYRAGSALVLRLQEAEEIVTAIHAGILGGYVILPMTGRIDLALPDQVTAAFPKMIELDADLFGQLLLEGGTPRPVHGDPHDLRFGVPTSGTTGVPRLVGLSDGAALARWWPRMPKASEAKGFLSWTSFDHVMGIGMAMPDLPIKVHLATQRFISDPLSWLDALVESGVTHATTTNFGLELLVRALARAPQRQWDLGHIQRIGIGAETVSRATVEAALRALIPFGLRDDAMIAGYGLSECGPVAGGGHSLRLGGGSDTEGLELDRPTAGHAVRIHDAEGALLSEGEIGHIQVRGPSMTSGYIGDAEANEQLFTADHWLRTGDLGLLRDGKLTVTGREKELVIVNAKKYSCQEIESVLRQATGETEIYVAPLPDTGKGAACGVFIAKAGHEAPETLARDIARAMAKAFKFAPARICMLAPQQLPRTALGKLRRLELAKLPLADIAHDTSKITASLETFGSLADIWKDVLKLDGDIDPDEDFFLLGGDSLMAMQLMSEVERIYGKSPNFQDFPDSLTLRSLSRSLTGPLSSGLAPPAPWREKMTALMQNWPGQPVIDGGLIRRLGTGQAIDAAPLFWCAQTNDEAENLQEALAHRLNCHVMRSGAYLFHYNTAQSQAVASIYASEIQQIAPSGPLYFGGNCQGATMMKEVIAILRAAGRKVDLLIVADSDLLRLSKDAPFEQPVALLCLTGSRFNPQRWFQNPLVGLRKLAPKGLMLRQMSGQYSQALQKPYHLTTADHVLEAIAWAQTTPETEDLPLPQPLESSYYKRQIAAAEKSLTLVAGDNYDLQVTLQNDGIIAWPPYEKSGLAVANHWLSQSGNMLVWSDGIYPLSQQLNGAETMSLCLRIKVPDTVGEFLLEVDLAEEGMRWFVEVNSPPLQIPVTVVKRPHPLLAWWQGLTRRNAIQPAMQTE